MRYSSFIFTAFFYQGIKGQLKAESAAHTDTHASLVAANQELDSMKRVKVQLDEYRSQSAESAIQVISPLMFVLILLHITVIDYLMKRYIIGNLCHM